MKLLYTTAEAADMLGVSASYLEKLRAVGDGPVFVRIPGRGSDPRRQHIRYRKADLDAWSTSLNGLDSGCQGA